jgi:hypothetical protein
VIVTATSNVGINGWPIRLAQAFKSLTRFCIVLTGSTDKTPSGCFETAAARKPGSVVHDCTIVTLPQETRQRISPSTT